MCKQGGRNDGSHLHRLFTRACHSFALDFKSIVVFPRCQCGITYRFHPNLAKVSTEVTSSWKPSPTPLELEVRLWVLKQLVLIFLIVNVIYTFCEHIYILISIDRING